MRAEKMAKKNEEGAGVEDVFNPDIYDILAPEGLDQIEILGNYSQDEKKKAVIPLVSLKSIPTDEGSKGLNSPLGVD